MVLSAAQVPPAVAVASVSVWPGAAPVAPSSSSPVEGGGYRLAPGDLLRVSVYQNPDLTLETRLTDTGTLSFPLVGVLQLGGLGIAAAERRVAEALRQGNFVRQPQVSISLLEVRGHQASVLGQVNRPGRYPIEVTTLRLSDLLALAGGTSPAGADRVVVSGLREGQPFRAEVDLPALFGPEGRERDLFIRHGDTVWVDRQPQFYIYGQVQRPGALRLERGMTLMQALATGGGLTPRGTDKGIRIHRRDADGRMVVVRPAMHETVREGDVVHVAESLF
jgi:polysaccharide export outer membrane protein